MSSHLPRAALLAALLCIPAACAGPSEHAGGFAPPAPTQSGSKQHVTLRIKIPKKTKASTRRRGHYLSPATTQMIVNVQTGCPANCASVFGYPITAALTPTSTGCTSTLASTICELTLALAPSTYTATLTAEDTQGQALSTAQSVAFDVTAGTHNSFNVALSGIPRSIAATALGQGAILAQALDADGNTIAGAGAPTFTVARTSGIGVILAQPTTTSPNTFHVLPTGSGTTALTITASYAAGTTDGCSQPGAQCAQPITLTSTPQSGSFFVANEGDENILQYDSPFSGAPATTNSAGIATPYDVGFNAEGTLFVANAVLAPSISEYAAPYSGSATAVITSAEYLQHPIAVAFDSKDDLFVVDNSFDTGNSNVYEFAPPYTGTPITIPTTALSTFALAFDSSDDLFLVDTEGSAVLEYAPPYTTLTQTISNGISNPQGAYVSASGDLFVANTTGALMGDPGTVTEYAPPYASAPIATVANSLNSPTSVSMDASSNLLVVDAGNNQLAIFAPPYTGAPTATNDNGVNNPLGSAFHTIYTTAVSP
jgi:hypothetical protein